MSELGRVIVPRKTEFWVLDGYFGPYHIFRVQAGVKLVWRIIIQVVSVLKSFRKSLRELVGFIPDLD